MNAHFSITTGRRKGLRTEVLAGIAGACLLVATPDVLPQDAQKEEASEKDRSILSDPRLQNMLRTVKDDPEAAAEALEQDSEEAVRAATELFQEQVAKKKGNGETGVPATRAEAAAVAEKAKRKAEEALAKPAPEDSGETPAEEDSEEPGGEAIAQPPPEKPIRATPTRATEESNVAPGGNSAEESAEPAPAEKEADSPPSPPEEAAPMVADTPPSLPDDGTVPEIPDSAGTGEVAAPRALRPADKSQAQSAKRGKRKRARAKSDEMVIKSIESVLDQPILLFTGNVFVDYPAFTIRCDKLEVHMAEGGNLVDANGKDTNIKKAIASGGMVEVKRTVIEGKGKKKKTKTQIAMARRVDYDANSGVIVMSGGPPYIQDGESSVQTKSDAAKIIMTRDGKFSVKDPGRAHIRIPVEDAEGIDSSMGLGDSLGNLNQ